METTPVNTPAPAVANAPVTALAPAPAPATPPPAPMVQGTPMMAEGGSVDTPTSSTREFFKSINWIETGFAILGVAGLAYVIYYYRFKLKQDKMVNNELQRQIDEIKMNVQGLMKGKYKTT
jgi:hypothetical protein